MFYFVGSQLCARHGLDIRHWLLASWQDPCSHGARCLIKCGEIIKWDQNHLYFLLKMGEIEFIRYHKSLLFHSSAQHALCSISWLPHCPTFHVFEAAFGGGSIFVPSPQLPEILCKWLTKFPLPLGYSHLWVRPDQLVDSAQRVRRGICSSCWYGDAETPCSLCSASMWVCNW